jgi:hypothetical protein
MSKTALVCSLLAALALPAAAQNPVQLISQVGSDLLKDYTRPLVESYGVAMGSGLYQSAKAHKFLGFDVGVRFMLITIPDDARTFTARVKACSLNTTLHKIDTFEVIVEGAATIFGERGLDSSWIPAGAIGIPPALPGGLGVNRMPFLLPQASVGLPVPGMELTVRYIPWPFKGTTVQFLGFGLTEELTAIGGLKKLPFDFALMGFYQKFTIGSEMAATTIGGNARISAGILMLTPYAGFGVDKTDVRFDYDFTFNAPGIDPGPPPRLTTTPTTIPVVFSYGSGWNARATFGLTLKLLLLQLNADYNRSLTSGYDALNFGLALALR